MDNIFNFICMTFNEASTEKQYFNNYLSQWELEKIRNSVNKRKIEFLYGRLCAKFAYATLCKSYVFDNRLCIYNDSCGAPFFEDANIFVSITHEDDLAAAMVTKRKYLRMGIDVQRISIKNTEIIYEVMNKNEKLCLEKQSVLMDQYGKDFLVTAVWVAKEALSKLLGYGFFIYDALEVSYFDTKNNSLIVRFKMFSNFSVVLRAYKDYLFGFAIPNRELQLYNDNIFIIEETTMDALLTKCR